jgi:hypothetical protein
MACSQRPSRRQRRKHPYTVCQGGKSFGNIRHGQPVFTTYSLPLTAAHDLSWHFLGQFLKQLLGF